MSQGGSWIIRNYCAFFESKYVTRICFASYKFPNDWNYTEPEDWSLHHLGENTWLSLLTSTSAFPGKDGVAAVMGKRNSWVYKRP